MKSKINRYAIYLTIVVSVSTFGFSQQLKSTGTVFDESGQPMPGVSVVVKGTSKGVVTDFDGKFFLDVADKTAVLLFSYVGYKNSELPAERDMRITMQEEAQALSDVVVVGYGTQTKSKVTGSIGTVESQTLQQIASPSLDQQISGKMSGVVINQNNGTPGAASQIIIRGTGTLTAGANPLIVVDGFPLTEGSSLNAVNPNDIEKIDILKDAASAAIYGSRAANGVILVTTKRGVSSEKPSVSLSVYGGTQEQSSGVELVDAYDFATFLNEARNYGYASKDPTNRSELDPNSVRVTKGLSGKTIDGRELYLNSLTPYLNKVGGLTNTNWLKEGFRRAAIQNYLLSFSGGNEKTKYYTSVGYFKQDGVVLGTGMERFTASVNLSTKLHEKVSLGINIKPSYQVQSYQDQSNRSSGVLGLMPLNFPFYKPYKDDGSLNISDQLINEQRVEEGIKINGTPVENLVATALLVKNNKKDFRTFGNAFLDVDIVKGLSYKFSMGGDYSSSVADYFYPSDVGSYRTPAPRSDANAKLARNENINYIIENLFTYKATFDMHNLNVIAGHSFQNENATSTSIVGSGFLDNNIKNVAGASSYSVAPVSYSWALESYLSRIQYDYDSKYLFSAAIRSDGSSRFGKKNRYGYFPSLSAGWVLSREAFFPKNNILTFAKISASWGQTGNNQIPNYGSYALVTASNYVYSRSIAAGYTSTTAANANLGWEIASAFNTGLDLAFFDNKINISASYYNTKRKDLLLDVPVPQQSGYSSALTNIGKMENQGVEFQLSGANFKAGNFTIGFNANITTYTNKVLALGPGQTEIVTGIDQNFVTRVGGPIAQIYGYQIDGVYKSTEEIANYKNPNGQSVTPLEGTIPGDYKVVDVNKDGKIDVKDKVSKGTYAPAFTYGFGGNLSYKRVTLSFSFMGVGGRTILDNDMSSLTEAGEGFAVPTTYYFANRYHPVDNPNGFLGQPNFGNFSNARKLTRSSAVVEPNNGDYIRLRDVRVSYDLRDDILKKMKLSSFQIYVSANNLFTLTKFRGWNPDATSDSPLIAGYSDGGNYPIARTILAGINLRY